MSNINLIQYVRKRNFLFSFLIIIILTFISISIKFAFAATVNLALQTTTPAPAATLFLDQEITYNIRLSNIQTSSTSTGYTVTLPSSVRVLRVTCGTTGTANCGTTNFSGNTVSSTNATILGNATIGTNRLNLAIVARVTSSGTLTNSISVATGSGDTDSNNLNNTDSFSNTTVNTQTSFLSCPDNGFYARASGSNTILASLNVATGTKTTIGTTLFSYNGMAFNQGEGFNYAVRGGTNPTIVRIGANGVGEDLGRLDFNGFPTDTSGSAAEFDRNNRMYMMPNNSTRLYIINMDRTSANFMKVENSVTLSFTGYTPSGSFNIGDLSINPVDFDGGAPLYIYGTETTQTPGDIIRINPLTGSSLRISGVLPSTSFGGALFGASGTMYAVRNDTGQFYGVTFNSDRTQAVITSIGATDGDAPFGNTDAARCIDAPDPIDLQITKTTSTPIVNQGNSISYTLQIVNNGPQAIFGATITDNVPTSITGVTWTCSPTGSTSSCGTVTSGSGNSISLSSGFIGVGSGNRLNINISGTAFSAGTITNTGSVSSPSYYYELNSANNNSSVDLTSLVYDFGDAPDTYGTLDASSGAKHLSTNSTQIFLGTNATDFETNGVPGVSSNGDDTAGNDDEDSVTTFPAINTSSTTYSLNVIVTNNTGSTANLRAWIDFNRNGIFDSSESASTTVATGTTGGTATLNWTGLSGLVSGQSYIRLRLTTDTLANTEATGSKNNGEVEDYPMTISSSSLSISGKVFEDINYGGGAGRSFTTSSGVGRPNARVELYNNSGSFVSFTTTDASGNYTFNSLTPNTYTIRVVNSTVKSSRTGGGASELGVQTFRTNAPSGTIIEVTDRVGGQDPTRVDAGNGSTTLGALTTVSNTPQSISTINLNSGNITGVDFGFNFDTIVSTRDSGQGTLRQFILNSNALGNSALSQVGQTSGKEVSIFMIPNGVANSGQNTSYTNQLTGYGAARITLSSALPNITDADTIIDGRTQTNNVKTSGGQQTNSGQTAGNVFVGVSQTYLSPFDNPEVEIVASNIRGLTTTSTATGFELRSIAFVACGVLVQGNNSLIQDNLFGMQANGVESTVYTPTYFVELGNGSSNMIVRHNYVKTDNSGIRRDGGGSNMLIEYNEVTRPSSGQTNTYDGILIIGNGSNDTIQYNYIHRMRGAGSELGYNPSANVVNLVVQENTYTNNGKNLDGSPSNEPMNIIVRTIGSGSVVRIYRNIISESGGAGIIVQSTNRVRITENSIFRNGSVPGLANLGIDLRSDNPDPNTLGIGLDGVTPNDGIINSSLANNGTDYPLITSAVLTGNSLQLKGYVGSAPNQTAFANSLIEVFKAANDGNNNGEVILGDGKSVQHGEGQIYLGNCYADSSGNIDCVIPNINGKIVEGEFITTTATNSTNDTSEFSSVKIVGPDNFVFLPNNSSNAVPGSTIYYTHYIKSDLAGNVILNFNSVQGWTYTFFRDVNENSVLDTGDTPYSNINGMPLGDIYNLNANHSIRIIVKVEIPVNAAITTVDTLTLTAVLTPSDPLLTQNKTAVVQDITTVSETANSGTLKLVKSVSPTGSQPPGTTLVYTIVYTNIGSDTIKNIKIQDMVPSNTTFLSASFVTGSGTINSPPIGSTGLIIWQVSGSLASGVSGTVNFSVLIE